MRCNYLDSDKVCIASTTKGTSEKVSTQILNKYCLNEEQIIKCPRLHIFQEHLKASNMSSPQSINQYNYQTVTNAPLSVVNLAFNKEVEQAFSRASDIIKRKELPEEQEDEINLILEMLKAELENAPKKENVPRISKCFDWFKKKAKDAREVFPIIEPFIVEWIKKAVGV
ncbi:MAG: hypothetical protein ABSB10_09765 [Candidatus Bathyarchaeia archaeon]